MLVGAQDAHGEPDSLASGASTNNASPSSSLASSPSSSCEVAAAGEVPHLYATRKDVDLGPVLKNLLWSNLCEGPRLEHFVVEHFRRNTHFVNTEDTSELVTKLFENKPMKDLMSAYTRNHIHEQFEDADSEANTMVRKEVTGMHVDEKLEKLESKMVQSQSEIMRAGVESLRAELTARPLSGARAPEIPGSRLDEA